MLEKQQQKIFTKKHASMNKRSSGRSKWIGSQTDQNNGTHARTSLCNKRHFPTKRERERERETLKCSDVAIGCARRAVHAGPSLCGAQTNPVSAVWQLQPTAVQTVQQHVSYELTKDMRLQLVECSLLRAVSSRVRVRFTVWKISCYAHVFALL